MSCVPPSLDDFKSRILTMIEANKLNIELSGVALVGDATHQYYSASFAVIGEGVIPSVMKQNYLPAHRAFQRISIDGFEFARLWKVKFIMSPDLRARRWQVQYLFRN